MKQLLVFIHKEFLHVFRDKRTLFILFALPVIQILLFGFALNNEVKNIGISFYDLSNTTNSKQLIEKISSSPYFIAQQPIATQQQIEQRLQQGDTKCVLIIGAGENHNPLLPLQLIVDGSDPNTATIISNYLTNIIVQYNQSIHVTTIEPALIQLTMRMLYNEKQDGSLVFIPGVIALIFMIISTTLTSVAIVKEKEMGTMELLLVSPLKPIYVLLSKAVPYLLLSVVNFVLILVLAHFLLEVQIKGSLVLLFFESILFIITCLALGLLVSTLTNSQQTAMLVCMMGMMLPTLLLTGFMFPIDTMPWFLQGISYIVPSKYYYKIITSIMIKGLGFSYIWKETLILLGMSILLLVIALKNFKNRLQ